MPPQKAALQLYRRLLKSVRALPFPRAARQHQENLRQAFELRRSETDVSKIAENLNDGYVVLETVQALNTLDQAEVDLLDFWNDNASARSASK